MAVRVALVVRCELRGGEGTTHNYPPPPPPMQPQPQPQPTGVREATGRARDCHVSSHDGLRVWVVWQARARSRGYGVKTTGYAIHSIVQLKYY
ncbi:unnamed protein product [Hydatigera taeniaeformis]|uniref:MIB/HERC2 domain-containing protein n=1 Tax=Hydatigena taeniaeformis TaxID=6205 RepID=A0A0R3X4M7_HYDTA|nr:unnamed protein product [Hydatigera taeniaeformis]